MCLPIIKQRASVLDYKEKDVFSKQLVSSFSVKKNEENLNYFEIIPNIAYKGEMVMAMYLRWNKTHHHK